MAAVLLAVIVGLLTSCNTGTTVLAGTLSLSSGSPAPSGVTVTVFSDTSDSVVASTTTTETGTFRFGDQELAPGDYRVRFGDGSWWPNATDWATASTVHASTSSPPDLQADIAMPSGEVTGTVTRESGRPISGATVTLRDRASHAAIASTTTSPDGSYVFSGLSARTAVVEAAGSTYATGYAGGASTTSTATPVEINGATTTPGIDLTLSPAATLSGSVGGVGINRSGFTVVVFDRATQDVVRSTTTGATGTFTFADLPAGDYGVTIFDPSGRFQNRTVGGTGVDPASGTTYTLGPNQSRSLGTVTMIGEACPTPSAHADLTGANFSGANLANCDLTGSTLNGVDLSGANLSGATLQGTIVDGATLTGVTFDGATTAGLIGAPAALSPGWIVQGGVLFPPNG